MRRRALQPYIKKRWGGIFLAWNIMFTDVLVLNFWRWKIRYFWAKKLMEIWYLQITEKFLFWLVLIFSGMRNTAFFDPKSCWKDDIYRLLKSSCFNLFRDGKHGLFLSQKVDGKMILTDYCKVLVLIFSGMWNTVFFEPKSWWKDDIYWLLRSSCFELFGDRKYGLFFS